MSNLYRCPVHGVDLKYKSGTNEKGPWGRYGCPVKGEDGTWCQEKQWASPPAEEMVRLLGTIIGEVRSLQELIDDIRMTARQKAGTYPASVLNGTAPAAKATPKPVGATPVEVPPPPKDEDLIRPEDIPF